MVWLSGEEGGGKEGRREEGGGKEGGREEGGGKEGGREEGGGEKRGGGRKGGEKRGGGRKGGEKRGKSLLDGSLLLEEHRVCEFIPDSPHSLDLISYVGDVLFLALTYRSRVSTITM